MELCKQQEIKDCFLFIEDALPAKRCQCSVANFNFATNHWEANIVSSLVKGQRFELLLVSLKPVKTCQEPLVACKFFNIIMKLEVALYARKTGKTTFHFTLIYEKRDN